MADEKEKVVTNVNETDEESALEAGWDVAGTEDPPEKNIPASAEKATTEEEAPKKEVPTDEATEKASAEKEVPTDEATEKASAEKEVPTEKDTEKVPAEKAAAEEEAPKKEVNEFLEFDNLVSKKEKGVAPPKDFVPHEAFHAEREKRKDLQKRLDALETKQKLPVSDSYSEEKNPEIEELRAKQAKFEQWQADQETLKAENAVKERQAAVQTNLSEVDKKMTDAGFPGFIQSTQAVKAKIIKLADGDAIIGKRLDTPTGWGYVWQKHVQPELKAIFTSQVDKQRIEDKEALKKEANLIATPHTVDKKPKEDDSWDIGDYAAMMEKDSLVNKGV